MIGAGLDVQRQGDDTVMVGAGLDVQRHIARPHLLRPYHPFDATAKYRQHTEQARNALPRNQLLIRYAVTSPVQTVTIRCYDTR
jgi:hypothetical protein